jgi:diguanylate cyclase
MMQKMMNNRKEISDFLRISICECSRRQELFSVMFVRLRGMRRINTLLGYEAGETARCASAQMLARALPDCDAAGWLSDDEMLIISRDCNSPSCAVNGSKAAIEALSKPLSLAGTECMLEPVIGIALFPLDGKTEIDIIRHSALAAGRAEAEHDPYFAFFTSDLGQAALGEFELQQGVRKAISQKQFALHMQPKVNSRTHASMGAEALLRWNHPDGQTRVPDAFIAVAERGGLMKPLGHWVLREGCRILAGWDRNGVRNAALSVNVSPQQLTTPDWSSHVAAVLEEFSVRPLSLTLEITESCAMADVAASAAQMRELKAIGVRISMDDFGTGHSSLAYLTKLPLDEVKIDRMFVKAIGRSPAGEMICRSMISLAQDLGMSVVAEGVETPQQALMLHQMGCNQLQGWLFAKAMPEPDFTGWMASTGDAAPMLHSA